MILYRFLSPFIGLAYILRSLWAILRGSETFRDLGERFGGPPLAGPTIWIHGASVGEMNAARPVIAALAAQAQVLVTATTLTGRATVDQWGIPNLVTRLAPIDWAWVTIAVLRRSNVAALIVIENELWPMRIVTAHKSGIPVQMINARMSESSARMWGKFPKLAQVVLSPMALIAPQDAGSAVRLETLGGTTVTNAVNLKGLYSPKLSTIPEDLKRFVRNKTVLAAATHSGEEESILTAFQTLRQSQPTAQLIIAPRHPERGHDIAILCANAGFTTALRSRKDAPDTDVYIADTLGEMDVWYRLSGVAFIGGSLIAKGGHTPFEPTAYGCPIVHGPHVDNFIEAYDTLTKATASVGVTDTATLADAFQAHLGDDPMAKRAKAALDQPDIAPLLASIKKALNPNA